MNDEPHGLDPQLFLSLRRHLRIVHHVAGRIRLRISGSAAEEFRGKELDRDILDRVLEKMDGIEDVRVNAMAASAVISYRPGVIRPVWWDTLINGDEGEAVGLLRDLAANELAPAVDAVLNAGRNQQ